VLSNSAAKRCAVAPFGNDQRLRPVVRDHRRRYEHATVGRGGRSRARADSTVVILEATIVAAAIAAGHELVTDDGRVTHVVHACSLRRVELPPILLPITMANGGQLGSTADTIAASVG
jgi:hypothetical protein